MAGIARHGCRFYRVLGRRLHRPPFYRAGVCAARGGESSVESRRGRAAEKWRHHSLRQCESYRAAVFRRDGLSLFAKAAGMVPVGRAGKLSNGKESDELMKPFSILLAVLLPVVAESQSPERGGNDKSLEAGGPASSNVGGAAYPRIAPDSRVTFRLRAPN